MLQSGSSRHWKEALQSLTRDTNLNSAPLVEYFEPLLTWLKTENKKHSEENIGW